MKNKIGFGQKLLAFVMLLLVLHFFFVCGIYYFERETQPEAFGSIRAAMWYIVVTFTTIGYGDVYPFTLGGKIISMLVAGIGSLIGLVCFIWIVLGTLRFGSFLRKTR
jgi:hypothetical protein